MRDGLCHELIITGGPATASTLNQLTAKHFCLLFRRIKLLTLLFNTRQTPPTMAFSATIEDYDFVSIICSLPTVFSPFKLFNLGCGFAAALPF
jgi:hypothetical protein